MEGIKQFIKFLFECLYYVHLKKRRYVVVMVWLLIMLIVTGIIAVIGYLIVGCFFEGYSFSLREAFILVSCVMAIVITMNAFSEGADFECMIIRHMYLRNKIKRNYLIDFIRVAVVAILVLVICYILKPIFDIFCEKLMLNGAESGIVWVITTLSITYLALTETIIEESRRYRIGAVACMIIFVFLVIAFVYEHSSDVIEEGNAFEIIIFGLGQLAFLSAGISNYRALYKCLGEQYKLDLERYYKEVVVNFDKKALRIQSGLSDIKTMMIFMDEAWKELNIKTKIMLIFMLVLMLIITLGIATIA